MKRNATVISFNKIADDCDNVSRLRHERLCRVGSRCCNTFNVTNNINHDLFRLYHHYVLYVIVMIVFTGAMQIQLL